MALFKINRGVNANLPTARHDGYAYFTTDDGKFYIDFADPGGVLQEDGTTVERKALNAERADYVGYSLKMYYDGTESTEGSYNGLIQRTYDITPEKINAVRRNGDTIPGPLTLMGETIFNNIVYLNDEAYADSMTIGNAIITGALKVVGPINGSVVNAPTLNGNATSADKVNYKLKVQFNGDGLFEYDGHEEKTLNISPVDIGAVATTDNYAAGASPNGPAVSANKLNTNAGDATHPVYFADGVPVQVSGTLDINVSTADKVNHKLKVSFDSTPLLDYDGSTMTGAYADANGNTLLDITPESINAVRRNGDTIAGPLTINGVFTVNNDAYIDSATIGDLLVNGGTRFVGAVNAGTVTASSFVGPLTGNASTADKVNHKLKVQFNGDGLFEYDGHEEKTLNITAEDLGVLSTSTFYALGDSVGGNAVKANALNLNAAVGSTTRPIYFKSDGTPDVISNSSEIDLIAKLANSLSHSLKYRLRGSDIWAFDGSALTANDYKDANGNTVFDLVPNDIGIFDTLLGSTVAGESIFNNVVYLNDETYADSMTIENALITGALRVVGDINGSVVNATTFNGNATSASKVNYKLKLQANGDDKGEYDGHLEVTVNYTASDVGALPADTAYAAGDANHNALLANALNLSDAVGSSLLPVYFKSDGTPEAVSTSSEINILARTANLLAHKLKVSFDSNPQVEFDGTTLPAQNGGDANGNTLLDITPEVINAVRRNGDTIPGPLTLNGVFTVNNDAYIDSATIGDLLINGGTRFIGAVNAGTITASSFVGSLTGNATTADKINHKLKIQFNGDSLCEFDGTALAAANGGDANGNTIVNITPAAIGAIAKAGDTFTGTLIYNKTGTTAILSNKYSGTNYPIIKNYNNGNISISASSKGLYLGYENTTNIYFMGSKASMDSNGYFTAPKFIGALQGNADTADAINHSLKYRLRGSDVWSFDGSTLSATNYSDANGNTIFDLVPNDIGIFDTLLGSTVLGESVFNNVVYLNDETYADSMTIGNALITGSLRVIGPINGSTINATSFVGTLTGNATSADKVNHKLKILFNGSDKCEFDGSALAAANGGDANGNTIINITPTDIHAVDDRGDTMTGALTVGDITIGGASGTVAGKTIASNNTFYLNRKANTSLIFQLGGTEHARFDTSGNLIPASGSTTTIGTSSSPWTNIYATTFTGNATSADKVNHSLKYRLRGNDIWAYDGSACSYEPISDANGNTIFDLVPNDMGIFDTLLGSTVSGESIFNNVVYLNDETYADSITIENGLVTGAFRIVGDLNASIINATTLNGNATSADKVNYKLKILFNGTNKCEFDGTGIGTNNDEDTIVNVTPADIAAAPAVNGIYYGTCATAKGTKNKEVILVNGTGFLLVAGAMLVVKFTNASAAATMTLKVGTDAASAAAATGHTLYQYGTTKMADGTGTDGWPAGAIVLFIYDGTSWFRQFWYNSTYTLPTVTNIDCGTKAATAAKAITNGTWLAERDGNIQEVTMRYANTHAGALTFHSKPLYINGHPSSATNYTLPAGKYMVYFNGDYYCFNTSGHYAGRDFIHAINVGGTSGGTANAYTYYRFAQFHITGASATASTLTRYRATYKTNNIYLASLLNNGYTFTVDFTLTANASNNISLSNINCSFNGAMPYYNECYYAVSSDHKTLELYWANFSTNYYRANIELLSVEKVETSSSTPEGIAYIADTGYELTFLSLNDVTTTSTPVGTVSRISNYASSKFAEYASYLYLYAAPANNTYKYFLSGGLLLATSTNYDKIESLACYSPDVYILNRELYAPLHVAKFYGTENVSYGTTLPSSPTTGQLFFQIDGATGGSSGSSGGSLSLAQKSSGTMYVLGYDGSDSTKAYYNTNVYVDCTNGVLRGAAWNDYAEYRRDNHFEKRLQKPGNCVKENGDGTLSLTTKRLERGCEIISDTFGMAIGQNAREGYDTPIAVSGRVLAYPYESIEEFKAHIGYPVCSGPNGTVSIMTDEEEEKYSSRIIGTISEIPTYDKWGESQVDVDGRVWIRIK